MKTITQLKDAHNEFVLEVHKLKAQRDALLAAARVALYSVTGGFVGLKPRKEYEAEVAKQLKAAIAACEKG